MGVSPSEFELLTPQETVGLEKQAVEYRKQQLLLAREHAYWIAKVLVPIKSSKDLVVFDFEEEAKGFFDGWTEEEYAERRADFEKRKAAWEQPGQLSEKQKRLQDILNSE